MKRIKYNQFSIKMVIPFFLFTMLFSSCDKNDPLEDATVQPQESPKGKKVGDLYINENAVLLNVESMNKVKSISSDLVVFEVEPQQSDSIFPGALLVGAKYNESAIENIMGKVENVEIIGNEWHVRIQSVAVEEFIYSGSISGRIYPAIEETGEGMSLRSGTPDNVYMWQNVEGFPSYDYMTGEVPQTKGTIVLPRLQHSSKYTIPTPNLPLIDLHSDISLTAGFTPIFDYTINFGFTGVSEFIIKFHASDILLDATLNAYGGLKYDMSVSDLYRIPIIPIVLGPTGLIISPTISAGPYIHVDAGGEFTGKLFHAEGDVSYELTNIRKKPDWGLKADGYDWSNFAFASKATGTGGMQMNAGFSLTFLVVNIASAETYSRIGLGGSIIPEIPSFINLNIYGLVEANARIVLGTFPFKYEKKIPITSWNPVIYSKQFNFGK